MKLLNPVRGPAASPTFVVSQNRLALFCESKPPRSRKRDGAWGHRRERRGGREAYGGSVVRNAGIGQRAGAVEPFREFVRGAGAP